MGCASSQEEAPAQSANASKYAVDAAASKAQHAPSAVDAANKLVAKTDATGSAAEVNGKHVADGAAAAANAVAKAVATNGATPTASPRPGEAAQPPPAPAAPATPAAAAAAAAQTGAASAVAAQDTLMKVSALMQKFAEVRSERSAPVQVLRKVLDIVVADCQAKFACIQIVSENKDAALIVALVGSPDKFLERNRFQKLDAGAGYAAEAIVKGAAQLDWKRDSPPATLPSDWDLIVSRVTATQLTAMPVCVAGSIVAVLTLAVDHSADPSQSFMWHSYMQLVAASMSNLMKDPSVPKYIQLVKDVHECTELDALMHKLVGHFRVILGQTSNAHVWYRLALTASSNACATIFDDLTQVPAPLSNASQRSGGSGSASSSSKLLKDVQANGGVIRSVVNMKNTVMKISIHNRQQVMIPDVQKLINQSGNVSVDIFNTRLIKPPTSVLVFPLKVKQTIFGVVFCMSGVQSDFSDVSPRLRELCELMSPHFLLTLTNGHLKDEYLAVQEATPDAPGSQSGSVSMGMSLSRGGSEAFAIGSSVGGSMSGDHTAMTQSRSSTGALVTGLTEKLNQKRIKSAMDFTSNSQLADLQITNLLGEGGFAKVFRGLWQGLVVGIKIVVDDGKNEKMVMKNAHEIAILSTLSHPHVTQAYLCLTDVLVHDLVTSCMRSPHPAVLSSPAYKYLAGSEDKVCHVEVIEYCDLGNLSTGLKNLMFYNLPTEQVLAQLAEAAACGQSDASASLEYRMREKPFNARINMRSLLLTLIEIANALRYLHRMGVVHCDIKPANVLLKSSNNDPRGFTAKVSDFGLSRVEDDDSSSSFPFNSCGTAAYVAPEALICNKKVNSSVDVYAYGILMWEMYTTQRPYGSMNQQTLVEEVVMRSLRPKFPPNAPEGFARLAQACWNGSPGARPTFEEALGLLNGMLQGIDDGSFPSDAPVEIKGNSGSVEYMQQVAQSMQQGMQQQQQQQQGGYRPSPARQASLGLGSGAAPARRPM